MMCLDNFSVMPLCCKMKKVENCCYSAFKALYKYYGGTVFIQGVSGQDLRGQVGGNKEKGGVDCSPSPPSYSLNTCASKIASADLRRPIGAGRNERSQGNL